MTGKGESHVAYKSYFLPSGNDKEKKSSCKVCWFYELYVNSAQRIKED